MLFQRPARSINQDESTTFPSLEQTRPPPERPTWVSTLGESQVPAMFQTRPKCGNGTAGHVWHACGAETVHVKPPQPRHTACAPPRQPNRPGARHPRARISQRNKLDSRRRGRCGGECDALTGRGYHLPRGVRRHVQLLRSRALQTRRDGARSRSVKNLSKEEILVLRGRKKQGR